MEKDALNTALIHFCRLIPTTSRCPVSMFMKINYLRCKNVAVPSENEKRDQV